MPRELALLPNLVADRGLAVTAPGSSRAMDLAGCRATAVRVALADADYPSPASEFSVSIQADRLFGESVQVLGARTRQGVSH
jgi:hypothetical protein